VAKKLTKKWRGKIEQNTVRCRIVVGECSILLNGFFDSGNQVYCHGQPVSFVSLQQAKKLWKGKTEKQAFRPSALQSVVVHTVAGSQKIKVFTADKIEIFFSDQAHTIHKVLIGISPRPVQGIVLHPDLSEAISCLKK
jgi:hypothetical protein